MNIFRNVSSNTKLTVKMILIPLYSVIYPQAASQHFPLPSFNSVKDRTVPAVMCWGLVHDFSFQAWVSYWEQFDFPAVRYTNRSATVNVFSGHGYSHRLFQSGFSLLLRLMRGTPCHISCEWMFKRWICGLWILRTNENRTFLLLHFKVYVLSGRICRSAEGLKTVYGWNSVINPLDYCWGRFHRPISSAVLNVASPGKNNTFPVRSLWNW